jgi:hypothetical protein
VVSSVKDGNVGLAREGVSLWGTTRLSGSVLGVEGDSSLSLLLLNPDDRLGVEEAVDVGGFIMVRFDLSSLGWLDVAIDGGRDEESGVRQCERCAGFSGASGTKVVGMVFFVADGKRPFFGVRLCGSDKRGLIDELNFGDFNPADLALKFGLETERATFVPSAKGGRLMCILEPGVGLGEPGLNLILS